MRTQSPSGSPCSARAQWFYLLYTRARFVKLKDLNARPRDSTASRAEIYNWRIKEILFLFIKGLCYVGGYFFRDNKTETVLFYGALKVFLKFWKSFQFWYLISNFLLASMKLLTNSKNSSTVVTLFILIIKTLTETKISIRKPPSTWKFTRIFPASNEGWTLEKFDQWQEGSR